MALARTRAGLCGTESEVTATQTPDVSVPHRSGTTKLAGYEREGASRGGDPPRPPRSWGDPSPQTPLGGDLRPPRTALDAPRRDRRAVGAAGRTVAGRHPGAFGRGRGGGRGGRRRGQGG